MDQGHLSLLPVQGGENQVRFYILVVKLVILCTHFNTALFYTFEFSFSVEKTTTTKKEEASDSIEHLPLCLNLTVVLWLELLPHSKQDLGFNLSPALY